MAHAHETHAAHPHVEHDPAHDVDGKKLALWLFGATAGVFITVGILLLLFEQIMQHQRHISVELADTPQRDALRATEEADLSGKSGAKSIDEAIRAYVEKHGGKLDKR